jgi:hypothetical protein
MTNLLSEDIHNLTTDVFDIDENFLKKFSREFHQKIVNINDFKTIKGILNKWIKIVYDTKPILKLMQDHKKSEFWFSSIIGFFFQYGIDCDIDERKALESYLLAINNETLNQNLCLLEENYDEFYTLQNINI